MRNNKQQITRVHKKDDNDDSRISLRRGKRKRAKNRRYFNEKTVNTIVSNGGIKMKKPLDVKDLIQKMRKMW